MFRTELLQHLGLFRTELLQHLGLFLTELLQHLGLFLTELLQHLGLMQKRLEKIKVEPVQQKRGDLPRFSSLEGIVLRQHQNGSHHDTRKSPVVVVVTAAVVGTAAVVVTAAVLCRLALGLRLRLRLRLRLHLGIGRGLGSSPSPPEVGAFQSVAPRVRLNAGLEVVVGQRQRLRPLLRDDASVPHVLGEQLVHAAPLVVLDLDLRVLGDKVAHVTRGGCKAPLDVPVVVARHVELESREDLKTSALERVREQNLTHTHTHTHT